VAFIELLDVKVTDENGTLVETLRFCKNNENLTYQGETYVAANFELKITNNTNEEPRISLDAKDVTGILRQSMEQYGGGVGFPVTFTVVNTAKLDDPPEMVETFDVKAAKADGYNVSFQLGVENPLSLAFPIGKQFRDRCRHKYKGARCKYAGALGSCDYSYAGANGCIAHQNEANFGGFRGLKNL
jgi:phage-related protein